MRILRVSGNLYPSLIGGLEIHAHEMSKFQARLGHEVTVYTSNLDKSVPNEVIDGYRVVRFNNMLHLFGNAISIEFLPALYRNWNEYDVVHAHSHLFFTTNLSALVKQMREKPLIITCHGIASASVPEWFNHLFLSTAGRWTLNAADRIICYTEDERNALVNQLHVHPEKCVVIPNGINTDLFSPNGREAGEGHTILMVGRFVPGKGARYLILAAKQLVDEFPDLKVILIGWGPMETELRKMVKDLHLQGHVEIISQVSYTEMPDIYRDVDIYVLPSFHEGVPKSMLEAMACGKPVVISEFPHLHNLVTDAGLMVPKGEGDALADALRTLLRDPDLSRKFGRTGRKKVLDSHSWTQVVDETVRLYHDVLEK